MKAFILLSILLLAVILLNPWIWQSPGILAEVGEVKISSTDLSYKMAVEKAYGNDAISEEAALVSLVNDAIEHEVAKIYGVTVTPEDVAGLSSHTEKTTKAPEILSSVKQVFGDDSAAYDRLFLEPRIVNDKLSSWYIHNADIHKSERNLIEKAYALTWSGKSFYEAARENGLSNSIIKYGEENGTIPPLLERYSLQDNKSQIDPIIPILETLSDGQIFRNIVEDDYGYRVIKLDHKNGSQYSVETITASKHPFSEWFLEDAANVHIKILDKEVKSKIISNYTRVWWVSKLNK
jgi:hypothetical protein